MAKSFRQIRTMRDVWAERLRHNRRKGPSVRPSRPGIVRRLVERPAAERHAPPDGGKPIRAWVFSKSGRNSSGERAAAKRVSRPLEKQLLVRRTKEPQVDLFDEESELVVLADLPGVCDRDVHLTVESDVLIIEAISAGPLGEVRYYREIMLPYAVRGDYRHSRKGGVLEIHLRPVRNAGQRASPEGHKPGEPARARKPGGTKEDRGRKL